MIDSAAVVRRGIKFGLFAGRLKKYLGGG